MCIDTVDAEFMPYGRGGLYIMVSVLDSGLRNLGLSPAWMECCVLCQSILLVKSSYKGGGKRGGLKVAVLYSGSSGQWVLANCQGNLTRMLGGYQQWTSIPSRRSRVAGDTPNHFMLNWS